MSATAPSHTPTVSADAQTTAHATEAINFILAAKDCPSEFRPLIDYLIGASGGSTDWFEAADGEVGYAARPSEGPPSRDAATKYVQRKRKRLLEWEGRAGVAFVECMPGGKDAATGKKYKSRYKLNLLAMAEETVRDAQEMSMWKRDERRALELTAAEKAEATQGTRARKDRFRPPRRDENAGGCGNEPRLWVTLSAIRRMLMAASVLIHGDRRWRDALKPAVRALGPQPRRSREG